MSFPPVIIVLSTEGILTAGWAEWPDYTGILDETGHSDLCRCCGGAVCAVPARPPDHGAGVWDFHSARRHGGGLPSRYGVAMAVKRPPACRSTEVHDRRTGHRRHVGCRRRRVRDDAFY